MRIKALWSDSLPTEEAMASQQPFACDHMSLVEWLQFIFIPRLLLIIEEGTKLPSNSDIAPMAEYYFQQIGVNAEEIVETVREIDRLLTDI